MNSSEERFEGEECEDVSFGSKIASTGKTSTREPADQPSARENADQPSVRDPAGRCDLESALKNWQILHTPGHTKGSVCLYNEKEQCLISGDTLFFMSWGRTDLTGGSEKEMRSSLLRLSETVSPEVKVYPGHDRFGFLMKENY